MAFIQVQVGGGEHHLHALGLGFQHAPAEGGKAVDLALAGGTLFELIGMALDQAPGGGDERCPGRQRERVIEGQRGGAQGQREGFAVGRRGGAEAMTRQGAS